MRARTATTAVGVLMVLAACGGSQGTSTTAPINIVPGNIAEGAEVYMGSCAACHGGDATGITGLGKPLTGSAFVASQSEEDLALFIEIGRERGDPDNTTGVEMPPKGGNPALNSQDLRDVAAYLLSLNR